MRVPAGYRGQSNLLALAVALVALSLALVASLAVVDAAFAAGERDATERAVATATSEHLVGPDSPLTKRANVLDEAAIEGFDDDALATTAPASERRAIAVRLDNRSLAGVGDPTRGTTVRRIVLVESTEWVERTPELRTDRTTLPVRTTRLRLQLQPTNATIETVRINDRVVLHNDSGLRGTYNVRPSRYETATVRFEGNGTLEGGDVVLSYQVTSDRKAVLEVTVDQRNGPWVEDNLVGRLSGPRLPSSAGGDRP